uniref:Uncharacterized protein n=1 Tax=Siphoviridae sp. ct0UO21 TaxID=2825293 RepID=A0A8S5PBI6_9CAUD|nr:MAG TPA: hypothetical protein [Siphoviridae sp. ct0UO21]
MGSLHLAYTTLRKYIGLKDFTHHHGRRGLKYRCRRL